MALYPDTSCFYRAEVIASPRDIPTQGRVSVDQLRKHFRIALTRGRIPGRHTTNSNLKTTTIKNTWYRQRRSSNGPGSEILDLFDLIYGSSAEGPVFSFFFVLVFLQSDKREHVVGVSDVYHHCHHPEVPSAPGLLNSAHFSRIEHLNHA
jgi:SGF29 tudor-like domain